MRQVGFLSVGPALSRHPTQPKQSPYRLPELPELPELKCEKESKKPRRALEFPFEQL